MDDEERGVREEGEVFDDVEEVVLAGLFAKERLDKVGEVFFAC